MRYKVVSLEREADREAKSTGALLSDLRYAVRQLSLSPGFTLVVLLTVALGIGANTAIFSVVNGFLRPLPVPAPERIVVLAARTAGDHTGMQYRFSYPALTDFRRQSDAFSDLFGYVIGLGGMAADGNTKQFFYSYVTGNYFSALGLKPALGRLFVPGEGEGPGADPVLVLGYSCWQARFGGDPAVIGKQVRIDGNTATIVGVVPKQFHGVSSSIEMDGYRPLNSITLREGFKRFFSERAQRTQLTVLGRLKPGVTLEQASRQVTMVADRIAEAHAATDKGIGASVVPERLARPIPSMANVIPAITALFMVLAALVLLLACMNVANMLLVRAVAQRRNMAVRMALGSGRWRLIRHTLSQSIVLSLAGGLAGAALGAAAGLALGSIRLGVNIPILLDFSMDGRVLAFTLLMTVLAGIVFGLWPAVQTSGAGLAAVLHDGGRSDSAGTASSRLRGALVVGQVAGSLSLLIISALFVRSLQQAQRLDLGFDPNGVVNVVMDPSYVGYDAARAKAFYREVERRVATLPAVQSASLAFVPQMTYFCDGGTVYAEGREVRAGQQAPLVLFNDVSPSYFQTMRVTLLRGRAFRESDDDSAPLVAIVNQTMANRFWANSDAIGKRFRMNGGDGPLWQVVGIARDGKYLATFEGSLPYFYVPLAQNFKSRRVLQVRSALPPDLVIAQVKKEIFAIDPAMAITDVQTMRQSLAAGFGYVVFWLGAFLAAAMGILGMVVAVTGVYGVTSFAASQRTREIGIRMALGASRRDILLMMVTQGFRLVALGLVAGLAAAIAISRVMARFLVVSPTDMTAYAAAGLLLGGIALFACYVPARRAMRLDPLNALRHE